MQPSAPSTGHASRARSALPTARPQAGGPAVTASGRRVQALPAHGARRRARDEGDDARAQPAGAGDVKRARIEPPARPASRGRQVVGGERDVLSPWPVIDVLRTSLSRSGAGTWPAADRLVAQVDRLLQRHAPSPGAWSRRDERAWFAAVRQIGQAWPFEPAAAVVVALRFHRIDSPEAGRLAIRALGELVTRFEAQQADIAGTPEHLQRVAALQAALEGLVEQGRALVAQGPAGARADHLWYVADELATLVSRLSESLVAEPGAVGVPADAVRCRAAKSLGRLDPAAPRIDAVRAGCELALSLGPARRSADALAALVDAWAAHQHPFDNAAGEPGRRAAFLRGVLLAHGDEVNLRHAIGRLLQRPAPAASDTARALPLDELLVALGRALCIEPAAASVMDQWITEVFAGCVQSAPRCPPQALALAMAGTARLAGGPRVTPQHFDRLLDFVLADFWNAAEESALMAALAGECFTAQADPLDDARVRQAVERLTGLVPEMPQARRGRLAAALRAGRPEAEALPWLVRAGRTLGPAPLACWLDSLMAAVPPERTSDRARAVLAAIAHPAAECLPHQTTFLVCCLDRWLARHSLTDLRLELSVACALPMEGDAWRPAAQRGLRLAIEPLDVLGDPDLTVAERVALLENLYALPGVLTPARADEHLRRVIGPAASAGGNLPLLEPLLNLAPVLVTLPQLSALRTCAVAWMQAPASGIQALAGVPATASTVPGHLVRSVAWQGGRAGEGASGERWSGPGIALQLGRVYRAVIDAWLEFAEAHAQPASPRRAAAHQVLAAFMQAEEQALQAPSVPQALRESLQSELDALRSALDAARSTASPAGHKPSAPAA